jgi:hypothetical protein
MEKFITFMILGVAIIVMGVLNTRGNISTMHAHHRRRVSEENRLPFGKMVGAGTIVIGVSLFLNGVLRAVTYFTKILVFSKVGTGVVIVGLLVGCTIMFTAMFKYNKGIF